MLVQFKRVQLPRLSSHRSQGTTIDHRTYQAGIDEGKQLNIYKGINQKDGFQGRLLATKLSRPAVNIIGEVKGDALKLKEVMDESYVAVEAGS